MTIGKKNITLKLHWSYYLLAAIVLLTIYSYRFIFTQSYDFNYLEDFYNYSQWVVPQSPRIMGDGELYSYAAGTLLQGDDPFRVNPEVPPLGKYLYSLSILIFSNPLITSVLMYIAVVICFYHLAKHIYGSSIKTNLLTTIFASSAILITQIQDSTLDLPQVLFFITYLLSVKYLIKNKPEKTWSLPVILSGILLGIFSAIKAPLLTPLIIIYTLYLFRKNNITKYILPIIIVGFLTYLASYFQYFFLGNSLISWVKNQLWILNFYKNSQATKTPLSVISYLISGYFYKDKVLTYVPEWNLSWLFGFILMFKKLKNISISQKEEINDIKLLLLILIIFFLFTPFSKRYVLLILPLLILLLGQIQKKLLLIPFVFIHLLHYLFFIQTESIKPITNFRTRIQEQRYEDAYQHLTKDSKKNISRQSFTSTLRKVDESLQVSSAEVSLKNPPIISSNSIINSPFSISRFTPIGNYQLDRKINLIKENNQWLVEWDWQIVSPEFTASDTLLMEIESVIGGNLVTADNRQLSWSGEKDYLFILGLDHQDNELFQHVSNITGVEFDKIRAKTYVKSDVGAKIPIGFIGWDVNLESLNQVIDNKNIIIEKRIGRLYPQGLIDRKYLKKIQLVEREHPEIFPTVGGEIYLIKSDKTIPIFKSISISGKNVVLDQEIHQVLDENAAILF